MKPLRIYVAGPYCPQNCSLHEASQIAQRNVNKAIEVGNRLIEKGHFVFIPHLDHYIHTHYSCRKDYGEWWYEEDNTFLEHWAEALFFISSSRGAYAELQFAQRLGLKIFFNLSEVPNTFLSTGSSSEESGLEVSER